MSILAVSVSHRSTSMARLAALALDPATAGKLAQTLVDSEHIDEAVVLSTCNRTELWVSVSRFHGGLDDAVLALSDLAGEPVEDLRAMARVFFDEGAVAHAFSLAAGLDSVVLGESQILGQVRGALVVCQEQGTVGTVLNALFQQAIRVGKRVQTETGVAGAGRSLVTAAYDLLVEAQGDLVDRRVLVVGAGAMAGLAARTAAAAGAHVTCVNRTLERAQRLADSVGGRAEPLSRLSDALEEADVVVTCTGARSLHLDAADFVGTPVTAAVDLALPADISADVTGLGILLVNLDLLVATRSETATPEVEAARELVRSEVRDFLGVRRAAAVAPTVVALRSMASQVVAAEMKRLDARVPGLDDHERDEVGRTMRRIADKLLHAPTVRVKELSADPDALDYAAALRELFALDPQAVAAVMSPETNV